MIRGLTVSAALGAALAAGPVGIDEARANIVKHVSSFEAAGQDMCTKYSCCNVTSSDACNLADMPKDETTLVLPGGETRCIYSYSTPFAFQVIPGASDKVLLYFQGGGACWDKASTNLGFCTSDVSPQSDVGVFDRTNVKNEFRDYTIVHVMYCSGDIFGGNVVRDYDDKDGVPVTQKGFKNAEASLDWIVGQQTAGNLASTLSNLVVMGCSAGSIGAQLWSNQAVTRLKWNQAAVVPDSYAGVFPPGSQGPLIYDYGMCTVSEGFLSAENQAKCEAETLTLQDINGEFIAATPDVPFSFIQSKTDIVQMSFYVAIGVTTPDATASINPEAFYNDVNEVFGGYNSHDNFLTYLVDGDQHCFSPMSLFFTADGISAEDDGKSSTQEMMYEWAGHFPLSNSASEKTVCEGDLQSSKGYGAVNNQTYCSSAVYPKEYIENYSA